MPDRDYTTDFSDNNFWDKVKGYARTAGKSVLEPALKMYYSATDAATPVWAKTTIYGALGYFISPLDAVPDMLPVVGYTDDLGILLAAAAAVAAHITPEHAGRARETLRQWFD
jgi:uncharacterized membrane protein YkvA (DUF1232 family)